MGVYQSIYLGPYVTARASAQLRETDVHGCTNAACAEYTRRDPSARHRPAFCGTCGSPIGKTTMVLPHRPSPYDVLEDREQLAVIDDEGDEDVVYFVPNVGGTGRSFGDGDHHLDLSEEDREAGMKLFEEQFEEDIALLRKVYEVEICWGIHVYWR